MDEAFAIQERWPELFAPLSTVDRQAVASAFATRWQEGWTLSREDVENLTDYVRGAIDRDEYDRRATAAAERVRVMDLWLASKD